MKFPPPQQGFGLHNVDVKFHCCFYFLEQISWNEILYSVNASVVGLARCASDEVRIGSSDPVFIFLEMPYKSFQYIHGYFEDYAIWYHKYFNTYHTKFGLNVAYLTFLCDETLFLLLQCRVSLFGQLSKSCKCFKKCNDYCILGFYLRWTRISSMGLKKISSLLKLSIPG